MSKFISGCVAGALILLVIEVAGAFIAYRVLVGDMSDAMSNMAEPPPFPVESEEMASGTIELLDLDGNTVQVPIAAGEILIVNKWATWCPPCNAEMPSLADLAKRTQGKRVRVLCVSEEPVQTLRAWREKNESKAPVYSLSSMPMQLGASGIPETWIIGADGKIEFKHTGMADWAHESVYAYLSDLGAPVTPDGSAVPAAPQSPAPDVEGSTGEGQPGQAEPARDTGTEDAA